MCDIFFVGHCTKDEITIRGETEKLPGGGVYFGAASAGWCSQVQKIPAKMVALTVGNPEDYTRIKAEMDAVGIELRLLEDKYTTTFCHSFKDDDPDQRISTVPCRGRSYKDTDIPTDLHTKVMYTNPLFYGEAPSGVDPENPAGFYTTLKKHADILTLDAQGILRQIHPDGTITLEVPKEINAIFEQVDLIKVDTTEARIITGISDDWKAACDKLIAMGAKAIIFTDESGVRFVTKDSVSESKFGPWKLEGRTGRGDTVSASFILMHYIAGMDAQTALDRAAEITTKKMQHPGAAIASDM